MYVSIQYPLKLNIHMNTISLMSSVGCCIVMLLATGSTQAQFTNQVASQQEMPLSKAVTGSASFAGHIPWDVYVAKHLQYPAAAAETNRWGDVTVQFTVTKTGQLIDVRSWGGTKELRQAAQHLVKGSEGLWRPAIHQGEAVDCSLSQKISFRLQMDFSDGDR
jgi:hypothetical protein